jgi:hypothetical protein
MTKSVADKAPISATLRRHVDPPFMWVSILLCSAMLHASAFLILRSLDFDSFKPKRLSRSIPIEIVQLPRRQTRATRIIARQQPQIPGRLVSKPVVVKPQVTTPQPPPAVQPQLVKPVIPETQQRDTIAFAKPSITKKTPTPTPKTQPSIKPKIEQNTLPKPQLANKAEQERQQKLALQRQQQAQRQQNIAEQRQRDIAEQRQRDIAEQRQRDIAEQRQQNIAEQRQRDIAEQRQRDIAEQRQRDIAEQRQQNIAEQRQRDIAEQRQRDIAEQRQRDIAEQRQRDIAEQRQRDIAEQRQRDIAEQRQRDIAEQRQRDIAEQRQRDIAEQRQRDIAKNQSEVPKSSDPVAVDKNPPPPPDGTIATNETGGFLTASFSVSPNKEQQTNLNLVADVKFIPQMIQKTLKQNKLPLLDEKDRQLITQPITCPVILSIDAKGKIFKDKGILIPDDAPQKDICKRYAEEYFRQNRGNIEFEPGRDSGNKPVSSGLWVEIEIQPVAVDRKIPN